MAKNITVTLTPARARALIWAVNIFEMSYEGDGTGFDDLDRDAARALRTLAPLYEAACQIDEN